MRGLLRHWLQVGLTLEGSSIGRSRLVEEPWASAGIAVARPSMRSRTSCPKDPDEAVEALGELQVDVIANELSVEGAELHRERVP